MRSALVRRLYFAAGWLCVVIGAAGLVLPLVPGTLFLIIAAWCFTRSSPRFEAWLLDHPRLGPPIRQWRARGAIPRRAKLVAFAAMALGVAFAYATAPLWAAGLAAACTAAAAAYVLSRPEA
jgi:uncharacterized membrane protein YbaN (DUF454 family)